MHPIGQLFPLTPWLTFCVLFVVIVAVVGVLVPAIIRFQGFAARRRCVRDGEAANDAYQDGFVSAASDVPVRCPHKPGTAGYACWHVGRVKGTDARLSGGWVPKPGPEQRPVHIVVQRDVSTNGR